MYPNTSISSSHGCQDGCGYFRGGSFGVVQSTSRAADDFEFFVAVLDALEEDPLFELLDELVEAVASVPSVGGGRTMRKKRATASGEENVYERSTSPLS